MLVIQSDIRTKDLITTTTATMMADGLNVHPYNRAYTHTYEETV